MNLRITLALALTLPLTIAWRLGRLFPHEKVNWFLLHGREQYPYWYFRDSGQYLTMVLLAYVAHIAVKEYHPKLRRLTALFFYFFILRLVEYWLQAGTTPIWQTLGCMAIFTGLHYAYVYGKSHSNW